MTAAGRCITERRKRYRSAGRSTDRTDRGRSTPRTDETHNDDVRPSKDETLENIIFHEVYHPWLRERIND